ncbi:MAG: DUF928 domain-containing protein [Scytolyngbya sp. HA4215-MV1]|jgi:hypothetical protein|nr:DUF928 domain-containing protein [Scytolyngbya sp. HA4215-MV1]
MWLSKSLYATSIAVLVGTIAAMDGVIPAMAQSPQGSLVARLSRRRLNFRVGVRPSRYRIGGYSRGGCGDQKTLTAIVPQPQAQEKVPEDKATVDKTTAAHPIFFVHLPTLPPSTAEFILKSESNSELYRFDFELTGQAGVVGVMLPNAAPELQVGRKYFWRVEVTCNPDEPSKIVTVGSWVERVKLLVSTRRDRLALLAEQGIWQDLLTALALQRYQRPNDPATSEDWANLMEDAGLPQFKQSTIVKIVKN